MFDTDENIPDIRASRSGVNEVSRGFERGSRIEFAECAFDIAPTEFGALDAAGIDHRARIRCWPVGTVGTRSQNGE
jgi:hypothetical protein